MEKDYSLMTNNELKIEMKSLENSYEKTKEDIIKLIDKMKKMDDEYISVKKELSKRSSGAWQF